MKMHANGSYLGNTSRQIPRHSSSFVPILPQQEGLDFSHRYLTNQVLITTDWRKHPRISSFRDLIRSKIAASFISSSRIHHEQVKQAYDIATTLETGLFIDAASEEEYINQETLMQRLQSQVNKLHGTKCSQQEVAIPLTSTSTMVPSSGLLHAGFSGTVVYPTSQKLAGPIINATDYGAVAVNNKYGFPEEGLSHPSIVHELVSSHDDCSTITSYTDMDVFSSFCVSGAGSNLLTSSKSISSHFPQQHVQDLEMDLIYKNCSGTIQRNDSVDFLAAMGRSPQSDYVNLLIPHHDSREISEVSNLLPSLSSNREYSSDGDSRQYQSQIMNFQQNVKHFMQPYELHGKASMSQSSFIVNQGEHCGQMLGQQTLKQPQHSPRLLNGYEQFTSESSAGLLGLYGSASVNSAIGPKVSVEQILFAYFRYKNLKNVSGDNKIPFVKYLHSTVCSNETCTCEWSIKLLLHITNCQSDDCHICRPWKSFCDAGILEPPLEFKSSMIMDSIVRDNEAPSGNSEAILPPTKRLRMEPAFGVSLTNNASSDLWTHKMVHPYSSEASSELQPQAESSLSSIYSEVTECNLEQLTNPILGFMSITEPNNSVIDDTFGQTFKSETNPSEGLDADHISEASDPKSHDAIASSNINENVIKLNPTMHTLCNDPIASDIEDIQGRTGFNQAGENATKKVTELLKADQEKKTNSSNKTVNVVTLTEFFTCDQIREHIMSLRKQFGQSAHEEEGGIDADSCQLCAMQKLFFAPVPIYCLCCGTRIKRNALYYHKRAEEFDMQHCFCTMCYRNSRGGCITFNGISVSKTLLDRKGNNDLLEEAWVECNKCKSWQHQICALYNNKRDLDCSAVYICPRCRLKEIENGIHVPLPKTAIFGAKDLPSTMLSDHIESRLFKRLMQERADKAKVDGNKYLDEVLAEESLSVRVVLSVDKQLKVKKQFLDIFLEENYPAEFPYRSRVILLFQNIEGVDVCLFGMYVQEFGSECGFPNQRCVYISYLDSVKYFRPERETVTGEALRTFVYHEILIGYLDFCKKRGFTTCYIWACPPLKGEDYVLYCHPDIQKTPKNDKLRRWYHSMLRKAAEENIVVGLTNMYDHFFVPTGKCDSKVTAARLPYFDGDYWSGAAMDIARKIEQESGGEYEKQLKTLVTKRTLKAMGHLNPSEDTAKDILVMQKLGQTILPFKEDFIIVHLQHACMHCHEFIVSGKRWFCTECKKFQECERCHTSDSHTSINGEKHTLCQVLIDDIPSDTRENDIILDNGLFENRHNFLSFCQNNQFQFDTLRRAKHSSMMIIYHLKNPTVLTVGTTCSICYKNIVFQQSWQCEICPEFTICSACYKEKGANCHAHKLSQTYSKALFQSGNQELNKKSVLMQQLLKVLQHASHCRSTKTQPCSYPNCLQIKKLFIHASRCTVRVSGGCQYCKKTWMALTAHSRNCRDSECCIPRCMDLKKQAEWVAMHSESRRRAAVVESNRAY